MFKHEHFGELCASASVGQASPKELFELEQHAAQCEACTRAYWEYLNLAGRQFAASGQTPSLSPRESQDCLNSDLFTRRFFERAEKEGIVFSRDVGEEVAKLLPETRLMARQPKWRGPALGMAAAAVIIVAVTTAYFYGKGSFATSSRATQTQGNTTASSEPPVVTPDRRIGELTALNVGLQSEIDGLKRELRQANGRLNVSHAEFETASQDRQRLQTDRDGLEARLDRLQQDLAQSQGAVANAQQESDKLRQNSSSLESALVADRVRIEELTDALKEKSAALDKERQLLAVGHDVTDLMGARNLHIIDVVDTDPRGKTRPAFGRIFFTEGKSLLFYAYDLNQARIQKANYQYRVWASKEGQDKQVRSLGIFYSDDKAQRRWTFKCDDPKILTEIDSVFVTLEPEKGDPSHPHGASLMYAYLRSQPNHP